jgi:large subunit ribosomal protein L31
MKKGIHPKWNKNAKVVVNGKPVITVGSTQDVLNVEIWAGNHPFFTGEETVVDVDSKIDTFNKKVKAAKKKAHRKKSEKKNKRKRTKAVSSKPVTLKDMLKKVS